MTDSCVNKQLSDIVSFPGSFLLRKIVKKKLIIFFILFHIYAISLIMYRRCEHHLMEIPRYFGFILTTIQCFCHIPLVSKGVLKILFQFYYRFARHATSDLMDQENFEKSLEKFDVLQIFGLQNCRPAIYLQRDILGRLKREHNALFAYRLALGLTIFT